MDLIMTLQQTKDLLDKYKDKLSNLKLDDKVLTELLDVSVSGPFRKSVGFVDPNKPISDSNFNQSQGLSDFVFALGATLTSEQLDRLTAKLLALCSDTPETYLRNNSIAKTMLAYEMAFYPQLAEKHFNSGKMPSTPSGLDALKRVILQPLIDSFNNLKKQPIYFPDILDDTKISNLITQVNENPYQLLQLSKILEKINEIHERSSQSKGWFIDTSKSKLKATKIKMALETLSAEEILTLDNNDPNVNQIAFLNALAIPRGMFSASTYEARAKGEIKAFCKQLRDESETLKPRTP